MILTRINRDTFSSLMDTLLCVPKKAKIPKKESLDNVFDAEDGEQQVADVT